MVLQIFDVQNVMFYHLILIKQRRKDSRQIKLNKKFDARFKKQTTNSLYSE